MMQAPDDPWQSLEPAEVVPEPATSSRALPAAGSGGHTWVEVLPEATPLPSPAAPPLGIIHLMLWTAGSAVILVGYQLINFVWGASQRELQLALAIGQVLHATVYGPAVGSLLIWFGRRSRAIAFPAQAGEWLLIASGIDVSIGISMMVCTGLLSPGFTARSLMVGLNLLIDAVLYAAVRMSFEGPRYWQRFFEVLFVTALARFAFFFEFYLEGLPAPGIPQEIESMMVLVVLPFLVAAIRYDGPEGWRRGWLHWTGVAVFFAGSLHQLGMGLWFWMRQGW